MENIFFYIFLALHIISGILGLTTGTFNILGKKGSFKHKQIGSIFCMSMIMAGFSSMILSIIHPNYFLFMMAIFTIYLVSTGYRYMNMRLLNFDQRPGAFEWALSIIMLITAILILVLGCSFIIENKSMGYAFIAFSFIAFRALKTDFENYTGRSKNNNYWLLAHIQRMTGAYISSLTAFLVVNSKYISEYIPAVLIWLMPSVILIPLIIFWTKKHKSKAMIYR